MKGHKLKRSSLYKCAVARALRSKKFLSWQLWRVEYKTAGPSDTIPHEQHYTPSELAKLWGISADTVRRLFENESGVLRIGESKVRKRRYVLMRIPQSIAARVHRRFTATV